MNNYKMMEVNRTFSSLSLIDFSVYIIELKVVNDLHQRDLQITEYQEKLNQANLEIQRLHSDFEKLQTESNNTIHSLSQDLETLKTQLQDQGLFKSTSFPSLTYMYIFS